MRAVAINEFGGADRLQEADVAAPKVGPDSVLIRVEAAGCNPVDYKLREGYLAGAFVHLFPLTLGWDAAGVVEQVGPAVTSVSVGDAVYAYCRKDFVGEGTYAELVSVPERAVAPRPRSLSAAACAGVPLAGLTAYQALIEALALRPKQTVLIHAAAGGVGHFACQLANWIGANVIATASARNHEFLRRLGADETIDYTDTDVFEAVRSRYPDGIDAVFDLIGGEVLRSSVEVLRDGGRLVSVVEPPFDDRFKQRGIQARYVFVRPDAGQLHELAELCDDDHLTVELAEEIELSQARRAHELLEQGHVRGKIVLRVSG